MDETEVKTEPWALTRLRAMFARGELEPDPNVPPIEMPDVGLYVGSQPGSGTEVRAVYRMGGALRESYRGPGGMLISAPVSEPHYERDLTRLKLFQQLLLRLGYRYVDGVCVWRCGVASLVTCPMQAPSVELIVSYAV